MAGDIVAFLKFFPPSVDGKHLMSFQSETSVFKFPWRSMDEALTTSLHFRENVIKTSFLCVESLMQNINFVV